MLVNRDVVKIIARIGIEYVKRIPPTISLKYERAFESVVDSEVVSLVFECEWRESTKSVPTKKVHAKIINMIG